MTQQAISKRLKAMGMIQKQENWVPYQLKRRDLERRFFACEQMLQRQNRKGFLNRIVTKDKKWKKLRIYGSNSKFQSQRLLLLCFTYEAPPSLSLENHIYVTKILIFIVLHF